MTCGRDGNIDMANLGDMSYLAESPKQFEPFHQRGWFTMQVTSSAARGFHGCLCKGMRRWGWDMFCLLSTFHGDMFLSVQHTEPMMSRETAVCITDLAMRVLVSL